jgi:hypothetical protein
MGTDEPAASALVILRTDPTPDDDDTAGPDPASARQVQDHLRSLGFEVGALIGTSFSITAPVDLFRQAFGDAPPTGTADRHRDRAGVEPRDLPTDLLPADAARVVRSITFAPPPDFGPTAP